MTTPRRLPPAPATGRLRPNAIACGDARTQTARIAPGTVDLARWSPPYLVGKEYERDLTLAAWTTLIEELFTLHAQVLRPGAFAVVNIADVLAWPDPALPPGPQAVNRAWQGRITAGEVAAARAAAPEASNAELARRLGCSEQTIARRTKGNAHRTGRRTTTRVLTTSAIVEQAARSAGLYLYDHRIWSKTPAWKNDHWHASSYRAVDEWEHLLVFHLPGPFAYDRDRIDRDEWAEWGSRGIWRIPSVAYHDGRPPAFPEELAARIIRLLSGPDDLVLDPFAGSGTTTAVAHRLARRWIGIDADPPSAGAALKRTAGQQDPAKDADRKDRTIRRIH